MSVKQTIRPKQLDETASLRAKCSRLTLQARRLRSELRDSSDENQQLKRSLGALLAEKIDIDKKALLAEFGKEPTIEEIIAEIQSQED